MLTWILMIAWHPCGFRVIHVDFQNYSIYPKIHVRRFAGIRISSEIHILPSDRSRDLPKDYEIREEEEIPHPTVYWRAPYDEFGKTMRIHVDITRYPRGNLKD